MLFNRGRVRATRHAVPTDHVLLCVYRTRNETLVRTLAETSEQVGGEVRLWALDEVAPSLASRTVGCGPGQRLELLNVLLGDTPSSTPVVVCDDDVSFRRGDLGRLLSIAWSLGLDLAQPAHASGSHHSHRVTRAWPGSIARLTRFVEVGPLVVIAPRIHDWVLPFPTEYGMGWGLDVVWSDLVADGFRLGVVDAVQVHHHGAVGADYATDEADAVVSRELGARGMPNFGTLNETLAVWERPWPLALMARLVATRRS